MKIKATSVFKEPTRDLAWFASWVTTHEQLNKRSYRRITLNTSLGKTQVWGLNTEDETLETLIIFPGARTSVLFWDFDRNLDNLGNRLRIFMVETNGLPNSSDGSTPDIKGLGLGVWATEVMDQLKIDKAYVAGASFGGLIAMKLAIVSPARVKAAFLLNPGCLQPFSLTFRNLYYNLLPIFAPSPKNVLTFLDTVVFCKPNHQLSAESEKSIVDYEVFALTRYKDNTQKPYFMGEALKGANVETYLLVGDADLLFPYQRSIINAKALLPRLRDVKVFHGVGHGIETFSHALIYMAKVVMADRAGKSLV